CSSAAKPSTEIESKSPTATSTANPRPSTYSAPLSAATTTAPAGIAANAALPGREPPATTTTVSTTAASLAGQPARASRPLSPTPRVEADDEPAGERTRRLYSSGRASPDRSAGHREIDELLQTRRASHTTRPSSRTHARTRETSPPRTSLQSGPQRDQG